MNKKVIDALKSFKAKSQVRRETTSSSPNVEQVNETVPLSQMVKDSLPARLSFLSVSELRKWSEGITNGMATVYDKAMDKVYLQEGIGGGNHRMFDGGHDLAGAWEAVKKARPDDTFQQEVIGYASGLWKDLTTEKGLPFTTWDQESYKDCADWVVRNIPGATKDWFYDLMSYDALEVVGASLGAASVFFFFSQTDKQRVEKMIGSMGVVSVASANPLMGMALVLCFAYSYFIKKQKVDPRHAAVGAGLAGISAAILAVLSFEIILIELGIALTVTTLLRRHVMNNEELIQFVKRKAAEISLPQASHDQTAL